MRAQVPLALLPAHRRRVERGEERGGRLGRSRRLEVVSEHDAGRATEVDLGVRDRRQRAARLARRPARPPAHVRLGRRSERGEPAAQQLGLRLARRRSSSIGPPSQVFGRHPAELRADPGAARAAADEQSLHRELRQHAGARALGRSPTCRSRSEASSRAAARRRRPRSSSPRRAPRAAASAALPARVDPGARPRRDAAVPDVALEPLPLASLRPLASRPRRRPGRARAGRPTASGASRAGARAAARRRARVRRRRARRRRCAPGSRGRP